MCITETWLCNAVEDHLISIPHYSVCRCDTNTHKGGGCAIFIENILPFEQLSCFTLNFRGIEGLLIRLVQHKIFVMCLYVPPNTLAGVLEEVIEDINNRLDDLSIDFQNHQILIAGDLSKLYPQNFCLHLDLADLVNKSTRKHTYSIIY